MGAQTFAHLTVSIIYSAQVVHLKCRRLCLDVFCSMKICFGGVISILEIKFKNINRSVSTQANK